EGGMRIEHAEVVRRPAAGRRQVGEDFQARLPGRAEVVPGGRPHNDIKARLADFREIRGGGDAVNSNRETALGEAGAGTGQEGKGEGSEDGVAEGQSKVRD